MHPIKQSCLALKHLLKNGQSTAIKYHWGCSDLCSHPMLSSLMDTPNCIAATILLSSWLVCQLFLTLHNYFWGINPLYKLCRPALRSFHHCWAKITIVGTDFILLQQWLAVAMKKLLWRCPTNREMAWSLPSAIMSGEMTRSRWSPIEGFLISTQITTRKKWMLIIVEL